MNTTDNNTQTTPKRWMNPKELADEYGFTESNQGKLRMRRAIPFSKMGNYIRYDRIEIDGWIESNAVEVVA